MNEIKIIETVRDGLQGIEATIPTEKKIKYINSLLKVGFDAIDVGSFVSSKSIPQMADTAEVIQGLDLSDYHSKLMVLVANKKGAEKAVDFNLIDQIIYPFSISETFLKKNINADFIQAEKHLDDVINICERHKKEAVVYLAMAFGNPYQDLWNLEIIHLWVEKLIEKGVRIIPLSDITGESNPEKIKAVYTSLTSKYPKVEFGFHLHTNKDGWYEKVDAAYKSGCKRFDSVIGGLGGCPMTGYELLSNLDTTDLFSYLEKNSIDTRINKTQFEVCKNLHTHLFKYN